MPSLAFEKYQFNVVSLETIRLDLLLKNDTEEVDRLVQSARTPGFFYLDLRADQDYVDAVSGLYDLAKAYFAQSKPAKLNDFRASHDRGYQFLT